MTYIERDNMSIYFGGGVILSSLEADPLTFDGAGTPLWERVPATRKLRLEGYICTAEDDTPKEGVARLRRMLSRIVNPNGSFTISIDGIKGELRSGRLTIPRKAPFSGETAERFVIEAEIRGGYFHKDAVICAPVEESAGDTFPIEFPKTIGTAKGVSCIRVKNNGDIPVGFEAELSPDTTVGSFSLVNTTTGQFIRIGAAFGSGDKLKICTVRDRLSLTLVRGGKEYPYTGRCDADSELFALPVGESVLAVGDGATFRGTLSFREAFVSF